MIENFKFKIVKNILTDEEIKLFKVWCEIKHRTNTKSFDFAQSDNADSFFYGDPITDALLIKLTPTIEKNVDEQLLPSYSYTRIYTKFGDLKKHTDRPSCELSATIHLGSDGTKWPIYMDDKEIILEAGDCVIYSGTKIAHWREEFFGDWYAQVFLHWVLKNGKHKEFYKDKRHYFGMPR
jgi:hypothetical protein